MNRFSSRAISLVLAVMFLLSAAGISFAVLFGGTAVFAAEESAKMFSFEVYFLDSNGNEMPLNSNTTIATLRIDVTDSELKSDDYEAGIAEWNKVKAALVLAEKILAELPVDSTAAAKEAAEKAVKDAKDDLKNREFRISIPLPFQKGDKSEPVFSETANPTISGTGCNYHVEMTNMIYTGKSKDFSTFINYPVEATAPAVFPKRRSLKTTLDSAEISPSSTPYERPIKDKDDDSSSSRPDIAPPTPTIIVSNFDYGGATVKAASNFSLKLSMTNTSQKLPIDNIVMKVTVPEAFTMNGSTNTFYIEKMSKNASAEQTLQLSVKPNAEPISHPIKISFSFEAVIDEVRKPFTSDQEISIPVGQINRFSLSPVEVPAEIYVGEDTSIEATFVNKGKTTIYNVSAEITGNLSNPGQRQFIGNVEGGKEDSADFLIGGLEGGPISGEVIITYEDANMNVSELRSAFNTNAIQMDMGNQEANMEANVAEMPPETNVWYAWALKVPVWVWMVGGVVLTIFAAFAAKLVRARREKKQEEQDADF